MLFSGSGAKKQSGLGVRSVVRFGALAGFALLFVPLHLGPPSSCSSSPFFSSKPTACLSWHNPDDGPSVTSGRFSTPTRTPSPSANPAIAFLSPPSPTPTQVATPIPPLAPISVVPPPSPTPMPSPTPFPTPDGVVRSAHVPILMYHYISAPPADADIYRLDLSVTPANFEAQLAWLQSQGYQSITLSQLVHHLARGQSLPDKPIVLTFDDGYRDHYTNAFPLLKRYGYLATFFIVTQPIDMANPEFLSWDMVKEMHAAGMDMEPHGYRHYDLRGKDTDFLVYEIVGAKEAIEARTGETARFFCYPAGSYDEQTIAVLRSAHFWAAVTTAQGATHSSDKLFELARIRVRGRHSVEDLETLLNLDW